MTVQWARVEAYVDLIGAYLHQHSGGEPVPRPFNARLKYVRAALTAPAFINVRAESDWLDQQLKKLARTRNELVHSVVTKWVESSGMTSTILRQVQESYVAVQDVETQLHDLEALTGEMIRLSCRLFGLLERVKSIVRLIAGEDDFWMIARLAGDRG